MAEDDPHVFAPEDGVGRNRSSLDREKNVSTWGLRSLRWVGHADTSRGGCVKRGGI